MTTLPRLLFGLACTLISGYKMAISSPLKELSQKQIEEVENTSIDNNGLKNDNDKSCKHESNSTFAATKSIRQQSTETRYRLPTSLPNDHRGQALSYYKEKELVLKHVKRKAR